MSDDEFKEDLNWEQMDGSQANSFDVSVVPLEPSEDAQFNMNIQDRLARINLSLFRANIEIARLREGLRTIRPAGYSIAFRRGSIRRRR